VPNLFATSDLHVTHTGNAEVVETIRPESPEDWLLVAGDVGERMSAVIDTLSMLRERFARVVWVPGNHELWTPPTDTDQHRGAARYDELVARCRAIDVLTPEDDFAVWPYSTQPLTIAALFVLYDYSWRTSELARVPLPDALARSREAGVLCTDEFFLHPDPHAERGHWCDRRVAVTAQRLAAIPQDQRTILLSHWPLHRHAVRPLRLPEFAMWCGTERTEDWHLRYRAEIAVYGHLHIPRTTWQDGVRFEEVSLGYPREWRRRARGPVTLRRLL
jgi:3',5'-cyclic AMP phosphodiesterase CpdA